MEPGHIVPFLLSIAKTSCYTNMWPFKRKKINQDTQWSSPPCPYCGSASTRLTISQDGNRTGYVKVWRGQRSLSCRCLECKRNFYAQEPPDGLPEDAIARYEDIDEEELQAAEEELRRQIAQEKDS